MATIVDVTFKPGVKAEDIKALVDDDDLIFRGCTFPDAPKDYAVAANGSVEKATSVEECPATDTEDGKFKPAKPRMRERHERFLPGVR